MPVTCMGCNRPIFGAPIYCSTCQIVLCSRCFNTCSPSCGYKSYTRLIGELSQEEQKVLVKLTRPQMPEFPQLEVVPNLNVFKTPKMVIVEKTVNDFRFTYRNAVYQLNPFKITQKWVRTGDNSYHLDTKTASPLNSTGRRDWHPHTQLDGTICLGDGDSLVRNNTTSGNLEQTILNNFNVIESVIRDFGEIGHGYHSSESCINVYTTRITPLPPEPERKPEPLVRVRVPVPGEVLTDDETRRLRETLTQRTHPATGVNIRPITDRYVQNLGNIFENFRTRARAGTFSSIERVYRRMGRNLTGLVRFHIGIATQAVINYTSRFDGDLILNLSYQPGEWQILGNNSIAIRPGGQERIDPGDNDNIILNLGRINVTMSLNSDSRRWTSSGYGRTKINRNDFFTLESGGRVIGWLDKRRAIVYLRFDPFTFDREQLEVSLRYAIMWVLWAMSQRQA